MYCQNCGAKLADGSRFCASCGHVVANASGSHAPMNSGIMPAGSGLRFANFMLDKIGAFIAAMILGLLVALASGMGRMHGMGHGYPGVGIVAALVFYVAYYFFFESLWQRTPGKWITGTKVVREDGTKPTSGQILGRTFARIIPFEVFSFFGANTIGWHDRFSGTLVVPAKMSPEDVRKIDTSKYHHVNAIAVAVAAVCLGTLLVGALALAAMSSMSYDGGYSHHRDMNGGMMYHNGSDQSGYGNGGWGMQGQADGMNDQDTTGSGQTLVSPTVPMNPTTGMTTVTQ